MKNKEIRGIIALAVVTALSFGVITGSKMLSKDMAGSTESADAAVLEDYDVSGAENIDAAAKTEDGYMVTVREKGYGGDIVMNVAFDTTGSKITNVSIAEHGETENLGAKIAEPEFLNQFKGVNAPVYLPGMNLDTSAEDSIASESKTSPDVLEGLELADGTYEAEEADFDSTGYKGKVSMTVADGKITEVNWDAVNADGKQKSILSESGEYVMTPDGPTWKAQSEALAAALIENQSLAFLSTDAAGKTDAVSGVSISVNGFISLAQQCMEQAAGLTQKDPFAGLELADGTYEAEEADFDSTGYKGKISMTVADGKITEVHWDAVNADGKQKSILSENGEYVMTPDGPTWKAQSEALAAALIENQSLAFLSTDAAGKTDAVSGVSISVNGFISLAEQCLKQAAGVEIEETKAETDAAAPQDGTQVDAVSGATISSTAAVTAINRAYNFLQAVK